MDNGKTIDTTGEYPFADGTRSFTGAPALMALLAAQAQTHQTYSADLAEFVLARDIAETDRAFVTSLGQTSANAGSIKQLALTVIKSPAFTTRGTP